MELLLQLAEGYRQGKEVAGVVLNDIGTLYQEGVGIPVDKHQAEYWFRQAISAGDRMYALPIWAICTEKEAPVFLYPYLWRCRLTDCRKIPMPLSDRAGL